MRHFLIATFVVFTSLSHAQAQGASPFPPTTYPEAGTFCGWFKLCTSTEVTPDKDV